MNSQMLIAFSLIVFLLPSPVESQGWIDITPEGLYPVRYFNSFDFQDGTFEVFVWNSEGEATRGYRLNTLMQWDSIPAYHSNWCGPGEYETYQLTSIGRSYLDQRRAFSIFIRGGCITECFTHVYADTTGEVSRENQVAFFDDFLCAGSSAVVAVSPIDQEYVFLSFFDSLYSSSDGGQTFSALSSPVPDMYDPYLHDLALSPWDMNLIFVAGFEQRRNTSSLYKSNDMGLTWNPVLDEVVRQLRFHPSDTSVVYAATGAGIFKSIDRGDTWVNALDGEFNAVEVYKDAPDIVFAGGIGGRLYRSTDSGSSWSLYNDTFTTLWINGIYQIPSSDTLIVAATDGVFKVYDSFVLNVEDSPDAPTRFHLYQNYPNPFNPVTTIRFEIGDVGYVSLKVYDLLGREVATIVSEDLKPGRYTKQWDASGFASGVYFYRLEAGSFVETRRLVLVR